jgi:hypothetical protein
MEEKVSAAMIFYYLKKNQWKFSANGGSFQNYYTNVTDHIERAGFPLRFYQTDFNQVFNATLKVLPRYLPLYSEADITAIPQTLEFLPIINELIKLRAEDMVNSLNRQLQHHDRIFVQVDKDVFDYMLTEMRNFK